ncbi:MAG: hypothetical protein WKF84_29405 [Pyrinomonadaceae bacterium]
MRQRMNGDGVQAFGYVSPQGLARLVESIARLHRKSDGSTRAGLAASLLPQLSGKILGTGGAGWTAQFAGGAIEDRYLVSLQPGMATLLKEAAKTSASSGLQTTASLLPADTYQLTRYLYQEPASAWRGLNNAVTARMDALSAVIVKRAFEGVASTIRRKLTGRLLRASGAAPTIARLDESGGSTVTIVVPKDEAALRQLVTKQLGGRAQDFQA